MRRLLKGLIFLCIGLTTIAAIVNVLSGGRAINTDLPTTPTSQPQPQNTERIVATSPLIITATPLPTEIPPTPAPTVTPQGLLSKSDIGDKWPLTVESGVVRCTRLTGGVQVVTFETDGKTYAVNGTAKARIAQFGWIAIEEIQNRELNDLGLLKYPVTPILDAGLALCK